MAEGLLEDSGGVLGRGEPLSGTTGTQQLTHAPSSRWVRAIWVSPGHGVRAAGPRDVQMVCDVGIYSIDAVLQERSVPGWVVLGQVFLWDNTPASRIEVVLHVDERPVDTTWTDDFGEFAFTSSSGQRLGVALHGSELAQIELWRKD